MASVDRDRRVRVRKLVGRIVGGALAWFAVSSVALGAASTLLPALAPGGSRGDRFADVSCADDLNCVAVGSFLTVNHKRRGLIERWDGTRWTIAFAGPLPGVQPVFLDSVSCPTSHWCMAAGTGQHGRGWRTVALLWDGSRWRVTTPIVLGGATAMGELASVSCSAPGQCEAVGSYAIGSSTVQIAERWRTGRWHLTYQTAPASHRQARLTGVSCESGAQCVAVGNQSNRRNAKAVVVRWDGTRWRQLALSLHARAELTGVSCPGAFTCLLVGATAAHGVYAPAAEQLKGARLTALPVPASSGAGSMAFLYDVSCATTTRCLALGTSSPPDSTQATAETWDGSEFAYAFGGQGHGVAPWSAASCRPTFCMLAGGANNHVLTERYAFPTPTAG
jgi:hypothetical protein